MEIKWNLVKKIKTEQDKFDICNGVYRHVLRNE